MPSGIRSPRVAAVAVLILGGSMIANACQTEREAAPEAAADAPAPAPAEAPAEPALSDPEIAHVAVTANSIDSTFGELASQKTQSAAVRNFAQTMINEHAGVNRQAVELAQRLGVVPAENDVSRQLQQGADEARSRLDGLTGVAFDRAYIEREVQYHQAVLDALDQMLIPNAQNADLEALLVRVRPAFVAHLERARTIQGELEGQ